MSKILVDVMPITAERCPFAEYIAMTSKNACRLKSGMYSRCNLERGKECDKLIDVEEYIKANREKVYFDYVRSNVI